MLNTINKIINVNNNVKILCCVLGISVAYETVNVACCYGSYSQIYGKMQRLIIYQQYVRILFLY